MSRSQDDKMLAKNPFEIPSFETLIQAKIKITFISNEHRNGIS